MNMKIVVNAVALLALVVFSANVVAQETSNEAKCSKCPAQSASVAAKATDESATCPVSAAMTKLPKMTYAVGEESTCCAESAKSLAEKAELPVKYVVGDKQFDDKDKAFVSLVEQTESFVNDFITPSTCDESGTHTVAGKSYSCTVQAGKNAELVKAAVEKVQMTYVVGKETCACAAMAGEMAEKAGEKVNYKVGDEEATCCSMTARLKMAHAKYKAAVQALAAANKPAQDAEAKTESSGT
jgi:hypothetical protein